MPKKVNDAFRWLWDQIDPLIALGIGLLCSIIALRATTVEPLLISAILSTLTVIAFTLLRERSGRERLASKLSELEAKISYPGTDTLFKSASDETSLLDEADREVLIVQETGTRLLETNKNHLVSLLRNGKRVRIVLSSAMSISARLVAFRNANLDEQGIIQRSRLCLHQITDIVNKAKGFTDKLEIRFTPYTVDITCVLADGSYTSSPRSSGIVRLAGFQISYEEKLDLSINTKTSPKLFRHYFEHANKLFENSSKVVLLTGAPGSGKTTILKKIIDGIEDKQYIFFILSPAVLEGGARVGFDFISSTQPIPIRLADRIGSGQYDIKMNVLDNLTDQLNQAVKDKKIIFLDEIGPIQLNNDRFREAISFILADPDATLFSTITLDSLLHPFLSTVKHHYRSTIIRLDEGENHKSAEAQLMREANLSVRLSRLLPRTLWEGKTDGLP